MAVLLLLSAIAAIQVADFLRERHARNVRVAIDACQRWWTDNRDSYEGCLLEQGMSAEEASDTILSRVQRIIDQAKDEIEMLDRQLRRP